MEISAHAVKQTALEQSCVARLLDLALDRKKGLLIGERDMTAEQVRTSLFCTCSERCAVVRDALSGRR